ncbi:MAG: hypothetical protein PS018_23275 [bacterium]|nr:hypothetical protein [bacterium]
MVDTSPKLFIRITGPLKIHGFTGDDCTPRGRKACALLAMLALSPENRRSRVWVQDKLWGSRAKEQGAASLRQCVAEIRKALGDARDCLVTDNYILALDPRLFKTDLDHDADTDPEPGSELLEGLDIGEEGFEEWLRDQRLKLRNRGTRVTTERPASGAFAHGHETGHSFRNRVELVRGVHDLRSEASVIADSLIDSVAKTLTELGAAKVVDRRIETDRTGEDDTGHSSRSLSLRSDVFGSDTAQTIRLALLQFPSNTLTWSSTLRSAGGASLDPNDSNVMRCINLAVNVTIDQLIKVRSEGPERTAAATLCYSGILHLFRLGKMNFETADRLFSSAFDIEPRGIYLAWRAYLRTFLLAERQYSCRQTIEAEAFDFMRRALELEPHNSYVAGLGAHVQTIMRRSYVAAYELAERSVQLNHANPIGWACLGVAKSHLGKPEEGFRDTLTARTIAGSAPYRYQLDALSCIVGTMAGEFEKAVYLAEASHALAPEFAPPLRYLSALYSHAGQHDRSLEMVRRLQRAEPDFCYETLRDKTYPVAGLHRTTIIESLPRRQV